MKYPTIRIEFGDLVLVGFICHKYTKPFEESPYGRNIKNPHTTW